MEEYAYSVDEECFYDFDDAMSALQDQCKKGESVTIFKGKTVRVEHVDFIFIDSVIETFQEVAWDEHGEWAEGYLDNIPKEKALELKSMIAEWLDTVAGRPTFYSVKDIEEVEVVVE